MNNLNEFGSDANDLVILCIPQLDTKAMPAVS